jgi:CRISPR/Cas system CSM-associated protein Csm3 (group 7 of RAMP superfamily)
MNNMLKDTKLIVFKATLHQDSALSTGGLIAKASAQGYAPAMTDHPFMRDGKNRLVLRGSGLAGALIATARQLGYTTKALENLGILDTPTNHGDEHKQKRLAQRQHFSGSRWQVLNAHLVTDTHETMLRQGVAIQHDTSTAAQGALYDSETLPAGTQWSFTVECVMLGNSDHAKESLALLKAVLERWENGQAKFGASVARGLGWLTLTDCQAYGIKKTAPYPNRLTIGGKEPEAFEIQFKKALINWQGYSLNPIDKKPNTIRISGKIIVGELSDDTWGLDTFASGSHIQSFHQSNDTWQNYFSKAENEGQAKTDSDHRLPMTKTCDGKLVPFIPGGSIRGVLRHAFSRWYQLQGESIYDPSKKYDAIKENKEARDPVELLFGDHPHRHAQKGQSSALLVRDAYLEKNSNWKAVVLEHHAEDEFTASTFESAKFDRQVLLKGTFEFCMEIELNSYNQGIADEFCTFVKGITEARQLHLGGGVWRGYGSPKWEITVEKEQNHV